MVRNKVLSKTLADSTVIVAIRSQNIAVVIDKAKIQGVQATIQTCWCDGCVCCCIICCGMYCIIC